MAPVDILKRPPIFWGRASGHQWGASRIRQRLLGASVDFDDEARQLADASFPNVVQFFDDHEDDYEQYVAEKQMRTQTLEDCQQQIEITESYLWGLGIAGVYHQWERDVRDVISVFEEPKSSTKKNQNAKFESLCANIEKLNYPIRLCAGFEGLNLGRLIANAIKHGIGPSFEELAEKRPDLFPDHHKRIRPHMPDKLPDADDLRVGVTEFDLVAEAIGLIWPELEDSIAPGTRW